MAWSVQSHIHSAEDIAQAIDHLEPQGHVSDDQLKQLRGCKAAAKRLIADGVIGRDDAQYIVVLNGHAGEQGTESISIGIQVVPPIHPTDIPENNLVHPDDVERNRTDV